VRGRARISTTTRARLRVFSDHLFDVRDLREIRDSTFEDVMTLVERITEE
jgi:hypothetical protein